MSVLGFRVGGLGCRNVRQQLGILQPIITTNVRLGLGPPRLGIWAQRSCSIWCMRVQKTGLGVCRCPARAQNLLHHTQGNYDSFYCSGMTPLIAIAPLMSLAAKTTCKCTSGGLKVRLHLRLCKLEVRGDKPRPSSRRPQPW